MRVIDSEFYILITAVSVSSVLNYENKLSFQSSRGWF
jgi:hypothetical protein